MKIVPAVLFNYLPVEFCAGSLRELLQVAQLVCSIGQSLLRSLALFVQNFEHNRLLDQSQSLGIQRIGGGQTADGVSSSVHDVIDLIAEVVGEDVGSGHDGILVDVLTDGVEAQVSPGSDGSFLGGLSEERLIIDFANSAVSQNIYESSIGVGQYTDYQVYPTCGISTADHLIGAADDPRFFSAPERINAGIIWFTKGYVEYIVPNYLTASQVPVEMLFSFEIASEAPGFRDDWPSDIHFYINGKHICNWTAPGDFGDSPGIYTPEWWDPNWNQYGLLKFLSINDSGTYIDGVKQSDVTLKDLNITHGSGIKFRIAAPTEGENCGGVTLYGRSFGNYNQDILVRMQYRQADSSD